MPPKKKIKKSEDKREKKIPADAQCADYIRFWNARSDSIILLKAGLGSSELVSDITDQRIESLRSTVASGSSQTLDCQASYSSNSSNSFNYSYSNTPASNAFSLPTDSVVSPVLNVPTNLTRLPELETMNDSPDFPMEHFMTITKTITNLTLNKRTKEQAIFDLFVLASQLNYGQKRLLLGVINLSRIQKLPCSPLNVYKKMSESDLWSSYFDPLLSCLISDPDRLVHLRWTNTIPNEKAKFRPDAVISEKPQLKFGSSVGYGEAKAQQGCYSKLLCLDMLRLAIFTKNAIDVSKLDGVLGFQIHGFNITFYINQVTAKGIYTFKEIAHIRFPQSLEDLPSFFTLINIKSLLEISHIFGVFVKNLSILTSLKKDIRQLKCVWIP
ncbi:hypothetical protein G6F44_001416 [Rhizopus delemar]|nr:hypothetical protein G6F44_001416 [Rhizopus delemar]